MLLPFSPAPRDAGAISSRTSVIASDDMKTVFPMVERFKRFQQFLAGHTVRAKFHPKADAGPRGESFNVGVHRTSSGVPAMFAPHGRRRTPGRSSQSGLALVPAKRWDLRFIIDTLLTGGRDRESALGGLRCIFIERSAS
jgi:hypothetical protein